jgi:hypothetical protein
VGEISQAVDFSVVSWWWNKLCEKGMKFASSYVEKAKRYKMP